ncbi:uncharacterized protein [Musca autumnalis]|uniref:uncharacterized protein n=1 Tax=Musca autumnalis TaxID=221902 RepID=UPI003CED8954
MTNGSNNWMDKNKWMTHWGSINKAKHFNINRRKGIEEKMSTNSSSGVVVHTIKQSAAVEELPTSGYIKMPKPKMLIKELAEENMKKGLETKVGEGNKGYELLKKMGYSDGQSLGKENNGILQPLKLEVKTDRKGLGALTGKTNKLQQNAEAIATNVQSLVKLQPPLKLEVKTERKDLSAVPQQQNALAIANVQKGGYGHELLMEMGYGDGQSLGKGNNGILQPIKLWEQSNKGLSTVPTTQQNATTNTNVQQLAANLQQLITKMQELKIQAVAPTISTSKQPTSIIQNECVEKKKSQLDILIEGYKFNDPQFLKSTFEKYFSKIELMQLRLDTAASNSPTDDDSDIIVAKIQIGTDEEMIETKYIEFIRGELIGWIGAYQEQELSTPIFHGIQPFEKYISIICDNGYAFECLQQCVDDIIQTEALPKIKLTRLPYISSMIYCFDAIYEGVVGDAELFLIQIQKHKPKLRIEHWMIIKHEVFADERRTYFMFLIDERSALALQFQYNSTCCICLQNLQFRNRGVVAE